MRGEGQGRSREIGEEAIPGYGNREKRRRDYQEGPGEVNERKMRRLKAGMGGVVHENLLWPSDSRIDETTRSWWKKIAIRSEIVGR